VRTKPVGLKYGDFELKMVLEKFVCLLQAVHSGAVLQAMYDNVICTDSPVEIFYLVFNNLSLIGWSIWTWTWDGSCGNILQSSYFFIQSGF